MKKELVKHNSIIYKALLKYRYSNFKLQILEYCDKNNVIKREQYMDLLKPTYNICTVAGSSLGHITSKETRMKLRAARLAREFKKNKNPMDT